MLLLQVIPKERNSFCVVIVQFLTLFDEGLNCYKSELNLLISINKKQMNCCFCSPKHLNSTVTLFSDFVIVLINW